MPTLQKGGGNSPNVFISCEVVRKVWNNCERWIRILFVRSNNMVNHFHSFHLCSFNKK